MTCPLCKRENKIKARGLCSTCYESERVSGNLGSYTDKRRKNGLLNLICKQCNKPFMAYSGEYCSRKCYELSERVTTPDDEKDIIDLYKEGLSASKIAKKFNVTHTTILELLKRNGISRRPNWTYQQKYSINQSAFDSLDNEQSAYWLGFIYADGYVRPDSLQVVLGAIDIDHLKSLCKFLLSNHSIKHRKDTNTYYVAFHGLHLTHRLSSLGIVSRRGQFNKVLQELPIKQYAHFVRGYLDGDGYISKPGTKNGCLVGFIGQEDILTWIKSTVSSESKSVLVQRKGIKEICFSRKSQALDIVKWIYNDATIYLPRKYERAIYWMSL